MATRKTGAMHWRDATFRLAAAGFLALACNSLAMAETAKLTQASVKRFIASYPEVKSIAVTQGTAKGKKIGGADNPLMAVVEAASDDKIKAEVDITAKRYGFRDGKEWFGVARSVGVAYAHMKVGSNGDAKAAAKVDKAIAKIEDNDFLSAKQKKKLIKALREGAGVVLEAPPPENMAVVKAMAPEIEAAVK
jgi:hypothetical protein